MKIILSSQGNTKDDLVDVRFGRCKYFAVYDSELKEFSFIENNNNDNDGNQGPGVAAAQVVLELNGDVLLTERLGLESFKVLTAGHLNLFKCHGMSLTDAIKRFEMDVLEPIDDPYWT